MFYDYTQVEVRAGNGGQGCVSFRREKYHPKGGPNGGDGGNGGDVILVVNSNLHTLHDIRYARIYKAGNGMPGSSNQKTGRNGNNVIIKVPPGTLITNSKTHLVVADMIEPGQDVVICRGGIGGKGNVHFKSSTNQTPRYAQPGTKGNTGIFEFELKVLADVGLVGLPNAGKSTLLSCLSSARPKIGDYPFTTLEPHLGIVKYSEYHSFVMADIPGLIEGSSQGKGLGHQFLRHIERNHVLLFLIDGNEPEPEKVFKTLRNELKQYNPDILLKPTMLVRSKLDSLTKQQIQDKSWTSIPEYVMDISAVTGEGLPDLIKIIIDHLDEN